MAWYSDGTINLTNGSVDVVLAGGSVVAAGVLTGDVLVSLGVRAEISDTVDATHFTLVLPWAGSTDGAAAYHIEPVGRGHLSTGRLIEKLEAHIGLLKLRDRNAVLSRNLSVPPVSPVIGDRYIVAAGGADFWSSHDDHYAEWSGVRWIFHLPGDIFGGVFCWDEGAQETVVYSNSGWVSQKGDPGVGIPSGGSVGQIIEKTETGTGWVSQNVGIPDGGSIGQIIEKTQDGTRWVSHRELLSSDRDYFVDPSGGSDSNDGLSSGAAFSTLSKAVSTAQGLDQFTYQVTINLADATYTEQLTVSSKLLGDKALVISGNSSNPQNVVLNGGVAAQITNGANVKLQHLEIRGAVHGLNVTSGATVTLGAGIIFGPCGNFQIFVQGGEVVATGASYEIAGSCVMHIYAAELGTMRAEGATITISVPITLAIFIIAATGAGAAVNSITFINPANVTGQKYSVTANATINTAGAGASYFPGTVAGGSGSGGQFL